MRVPDFETMVMEQEIHFANDCMVCGAPKYNHNKNIRDTTLYCPRTSTLQPRTYYVSLLDKYL